MYLFRTDAEISILKTLCLAGLMSNFHMKTKEVINQMKLRDTLTDLNGLDCEKKYLKILKNFWLYRFVKA